MKQFCEVDILAFSPIFHLSVIAFTFSTKENTVWTEWSYRYKKI